MFKSILVGLDGSPHSVAATELGIRWARRLNALLVGIGIIDEPTIRHGEMLPLGAGAFKEHRDQTLMAQARRQVEQFLEQFTLRCTAEGVSHKLLEEVGLPHEQIMRQGQRYDLILLGRQTHFHFATQETPCETLYKVLTNTPRPVVVVPEAAAGGPDGAPVVVGFDGSLPAARALQLFQASGLAVGQEVHVVTVHADAHVASSIADRAVDFLSFHDIKAVPHRVTTGTPAQVLLQKVKEYNAGLLVMGAYGQPVLREFFLGSATRSVLNQTSTPLFLYH